TQTGHRFEQAAARGAFTQARRALAVIVERHRLVDSVREVDRRQTVGQELGRVAHRERPRELLDLVVEEHARRAPHHYLFRLVALEELDGALVHPARRRSVAVSVVDDATAVGRTADGDVVEPEAVEDRGGRGYHVRGAQHVAAQVEHDLVRLRLLLGGLLAPRPFLRQGGQVFRQEDLA